MRRFSPPAARRSRLSFPSVSFPTALVLAFVFVCATNAQMIGEEEKPAPLEDEPTYKGVVACDMTDACGTKDYMCICQKLMWAIDYNHPILGASNDEICKKWKKDGKITDTKCETKCIMMQQHIDGAGGTDPYVCFKAIEECKQVEKDEKGEQANKGFGSFQFRRTRTSLTRLRRRQGTKDGKTLSSSSSLSAAKPPLRFKYERPAVPPPKNLIPDSWVPRDL